LSNLIIIVVINGTTINSIGSKSTGRPVRDVLASITHSLGVRPDASIANPQIESFFELSLIAASPYGR